MSFIRQRAACCGVAWVFVCLFGLSAVSARAQEAKRELPPQVREDVEAIAKQLVSIHDKDVELSCPKAVENARYGLETMLEVGQRNRDGGYIDAAKFDKVAVGIKAQLATITPADCESAQGGRLAFYRCMSSDYNHVMACAELDK